jgi:hypothetical protein
MSRVLEKIFFLTKYNPNTENIDPQFLEKSGI